MAKLGVQFLDYREERRSAVYGPFGSVQVTHAVLRTAEPDTDELAALVGLIGWIAPDQRSYSDFVVAPYDDFPRDL